MYFVSAFLTLENLCFLFSNFNNSNVLLTLIVCTCLMQIIMNVHLTDSINGYTVAYMKIGVCGEQP